jgi:hypothetical protein
VSKFERTPRRWRCAASQLVTGVPGTK